MVRKYVRGMEYLGREQKNSGVLGARRGTIKNLRQRRWKSEGAVKSAQKEGAFGSKGCQRGGGARTLAYFLTISLGTADEDVEDTTSVLDDSMEDEAESTEVAGSMNYCRICDETFLHPQIYKDHMRRHDGS